MLYCKRQAKEKFKDERRIAMFKYITIAADQITQGHSEGKLGEGDHKRIIERQYADGYEYIGWLPVTFGAHGTIKEIDLIFKVKS